MTDSKWDAFRQRIPTEAPYHVDHPSFEQSDAEGLYTGRQEEAELGATHMPDEVTRECARRMHYAASRMGRVGEPEQRRHWYGQYLGYRDRVVLGNRKLIYRAVRRWMGPSALADDLVGDCQIVLIQAVAAYNPWLGIRFSTYAFTCLMRALSRLTQRHAADRLARSLPLEALPDGEPRDARTEELLGVPLPRLDVYLREDHALLSHREKRVLLRRFSLDDKAKAGTLEQVGRELGLSKERVRQVQATALGKLRKALVEGSPAC